MDDDSPLVAYSPEVFNLPLLWPFSIRGEWLQQCDDEGHLERWQDRRGLTFDVEGEAPGDVC